MRRIPRRCKRCRCLDKECWTAAKIAAVVRGIPRRCKRCRCLNKGFPLGESVTAGQLWDRIGSAATFYVSAGFAAIATLGLLVRIAVRPNEPRLGIMTDAPNSVEDVESRPSLTIAFGRDGTRSHAERVLRDLGIVVLKYAPSTPLGLALE